MINCFDRFQQYSQYVGQVICFPDKYLHIFNEKGKYHVLKFDAWSYYQLDANGQPKHVCVHCQNDINVYDNLIDVSELPIITSMFNEYRKYHEHRVYWWDKTTHILKNGRVTGLLIEKDSTEEVTGFIISCDNYPQNNVNNKIVWNPKDMSESKKLYNLFKIYIKQQNGLPKTVREPLTNTASITFVSSPPVNIHLSCTGVDGIHQVNKTKILNKKYCSEQGSPEKGINLFHDNGSDDCFKRGSPGKEMNLFDDSELTRTCRFLCLCCKIIKVTISIYILLVIQVLICFFPEMTVVIMNLKMVDILITRCMVVCPKTIQKNLPTLLCICVHPIWTAIHVCMKD